MEPKIWGPSTWIFLHLLSMAYPDKPNPEDIKAHLTFLFALAKVLPCDICKDEFSKQLNSNIMQEVLSSKETYMKFLFNVHNDVNKRNNKPVLTYNQFIDVYKSIMDSNSFSPIDIKRQSKIYKYLLIAVVLSFASYIIYKNRQSL